MNFTISDFTTAYLEQRVSEKTGITWYGWQMMERSKMIKLIKHALDKKGVPEYIREELNNIISKLIF